MSNSFIDADFNATLNRASTLTVVIKCPDPATPGDYIDLTGADIKFQIEGHLSVSTTVHPLNSKWGLITVSTAQIAALPTNRLKYHCVYTTGAKRTTLFDGYASTTGFAVS